MGITWDEAVRASQARRQLRFRVSVFPVTRGVVIMSTCLAYVFCLRVPRDAACPNPYRLLQIPNR